MNSRPLPVEEGWATVLEPVADRIHSMGDFLREENASGRGYPHSPTHSTRSRSLS